MASRYGKNHLRGGYARRSPMLGDVHNTACGRTDDLASSTTENLKAVTCEACKKTTLFKGDFTVDNHGSIVVLNANTHAAQQWAKENLNHPETQHWGQHGTVVEPRYIADIVAGIQGDGLVVR